MKSRIFISYRRDDTDASAGRLYDAMVLAYEEELIFKDIDSIPLGSNFKKVIESKIKESDIVLVIIGKSFTTLKDESGTPRIFNTADFVRLEIANALAQEKVVIPVPVDHATIPRQEELPPSLQELPFINGIKLNHGSWKRDTTKLFNEIDEISAGLESEKAEQVKREEEESRIDLTGFAHWLTAGEWKVRNTGLDLKDDIWSFSPDGKLRCRLDKWTKDGDRPHFWKMNDSVLTVSLNNNYATFTAVISNSKPILIAGTAINVRQRKWRFTLSKKE